MEASCPLWSAAGLSLHGQRQAVIVHRAAIEMSTTRAALRGFFRRIHPDLLPHTSPEARKANTAALQELNALIDNLDSEETSKNPSVGQNLQMFILRPNGRLRPAQVELPPIPPEADFLEKCGIAASLQRKIESLLALIDTPVVGCHAPLTPKVAPLLEGSQDKWRQLLESEISREQTRQLLYEPPLSKVETYRQYLREKLTFRLRKKYEKIKNKIVRKIKLQRLNETIDQVVNKKAPNRQPPTIYSDEEDLAEGINQSFASLASKGYNPNFVFFARHLTQTQVTRGLRHLAGEGLKAEADIWLLENIFQALRDSQPPVPVILGVKFDASSEFGFMEIPVDFNLGELASFVDDHLDEVRERRKLALQRESDSSSD